MHHRWHGKDACSCHYIRKDMLEQAVLDDIRRYARLAREDEAGFVEQLLSVSCKKDEQKARSLQTELNAANARVSELEEIMKRLFEQLAKGVLTESRFQKLSEEYEVEQADLEQRAEAIQTELDTLSRSRRDSSEWVELIKHYADLQELDSIVLSELIEKTTVGEARIENSEKIIDVTIYYRFVGAVGQSVA